MAAPHSDVGSDKPFAGKQADAFPPTDLGSVPVSFLLDHMPDKGVGVFLASLRCGQPYWSSLLEGGIADQFYASRTDRQNLLSTVGAMRNVELAEKALRGILAKLPGSKRAKFFDCPSRNKKQTSLLTAVIDASARPSGTHGTLPSWAFSAPGTASLLLRLAKENGADFSKPMKLQWRTGATETVSPLEYCMVIGDIHAVRTYIALGHVFGVAELNRVQLKAAEGGNYGQELFDLALGIVEADIPAYSKALESKEIRPETAALFSAALAKKTLGSVIAAARASRQP